jgi:hypothetical protein
MEGNFSIYHVLFLLGGWSSRGRHLFDEMSGVTNNPMESLNAVFKRWLAWKELSLDSLAQMFYLVTGFYVNEVKRGFCGLGKCNVVHYVLIFNISYVFFSSFL